MNAPLITCQVEAFAPFLQEVQGLLPRHYEELALNRDKVPLDPNFEEYLRRDAEDQVLTVTAREAGRLCGYFVGFVAPGLHYRTCLTLTMDLFWLEPAVRAADSLELIEADMLARQLFDVVIAEAKRRGVQRPFFGSKVMKDAAVLFESLGLVEVERYYSGWWGE